MTGLDQTRVTSFTIHTHTLQKTNPIIFTDYIRQLFGAHCPSEELLRVQAFVGNKEATHKGLHWNLGAMSHD